MSAYAERTASGARGAAPAGPAFWALYVVAWLAYVGLLASAFALGGEPTRIAILAAVDSSLPSALLGVLVLRYHLPARWVRARRPAQRVLVHAAAAAAFVALSILGSGLLSRLTAGLSTHGEGLEEGALAVLVWQTVMALWVYAVLLSVDAVVRSSARLREQERLATRAETLRARAETLRARAELEALRAQFNPHFLFNALHSLISLVHSDPARAERAIEEMADLIRYANRVQRSRVDEVPLDEELQFVDTYLALETLRLGDRLRIRREIAEGVRDRLVPSFALQPLVENAVKHGAGRRAGTASIALRAWAEGEDLWLEVEDDGPGADPIAVASSAGRGLRLIRQRLQALYDDAAEVTIDTAPGEGFRVRVRLRAEAEDAGASTEGAGPAASGVGPSTERAGPSR